MKKGMIALYIVLGVLLSFVLVTVFVGGYVAYKTSFEYVSENKDDPYAPLEMYPEYAENMKSDIDTFITIPWEDVRITSRDGLSLFARYYHVKDGAPVEIKFHGYRSMACRDFSVSCMESIRAGQNVLLVDQRAHGKSEGRVISFGINERFDCIEWVKYVRSRFGDEQKVILYGISMGAATVLMAAGEESLPDNVVGIVADCPYSTPSEIITHVAKKLRVPAPLSSIIAPIGARLYGGFSLNESSPIEAVKRSKVPILLIHGKADDFVPYAMGERIAEANKDIRFVSIDGAGHCFSYFVDPETYLSEVNSFVERVTA